MRSYCAILTDRSILPENLRITYWSTSKLSSFITQTGFGLRKELSVYGDDYPTPDGTAVDYIHVVDLAKLMSSLCNDCMKLLKSKHSTRHRNRKFSIRG
jgi:UDP-glucose 4-epimerase